MRPTLSMEDYLKALYALEELGQQGTTSALARRLGVRPASVTGMLKRMAQAGLVEYRPRAGARLTPQGRRLALQVIRKHRLLERFLHDILGFPWDQVHAEAERLEHAVSDEFIQRLAAWLGEPEQDPHGHPIPGPDLKPPPRRGIPLDHIPVGRPVRVVQVSDRDAVALRRLAELGLRPGQQLVIRRRTPLDALLDIELQPQGAQIVLGPALAHYVLVELVEPPDATAAPERTRTPEASA